MKTLKASKSTAAILKVTSTICKESCCATVRIESGKKTEIATYIVTCITPSEEYTVRKGGENGIEERYTVNLWNETCECDGYANGYRCRHLRLIPALRKNGKIN